jgi:hypothetical protein
VAEKRKANIRRAWNLSLLGEGVTLNHHQATRLETAFTAGKLSAATVASLARTHTEKTLVYPAGFRYYQAWLVEDCDGGVIQSMVLVQVSGLVRRPF